MNILISWFRTKATVRLLVDISTWRFWTNLELAGATLKGSLGRGQEQIRKTLILTICLWWFLGHLGTNLKSTVLVLWLCSTMGDHFGTVQPWYCNEMPTWLSIKPDWTSEPYTTSYGTDSIHQQPAIPRWGPLTHPRSCVVQQFLALHEAQGATAGAGPTVGSASTGVLPDRHYRNGSLHNVKSGILPNKL